VTAPIFSADALAALRQQNVGSLTSLARIDGPVVSGSGGGGANAGGRAWHTVDGGAAVPCRMAPLVPAIESTQADENVNIARWVVVFDLTGPAVAEGQRLTITGVDVAGNAWSRVVLVVGSRSPRTFSAMRTFICQDVGPGMGAGPT
jgi:hypothetical protein